MKKKITEADKPTKTKDRVNLDNIMAEPAGNLPSASTKTTGNVAGPISISDLKRASDSEITAATSRLSASDDMRRLRNMMDLSGLDAVEVPADYQHTAADAGHEPVTTDNLPSVINKQIATTDGNSVNPAWLTVSKLPGNYRAVIEMVGKQLFGDFTRTPTNNIVMIGTVGSSGPTDIRDVHAVKTWIERHGPKVDETSISFNHLIPGYTATTEHHVVGDVHYSIVKDFIHGEQAGVYVYAWPEKDSKHSRYTQAVGGPANTKMLQNR